MTSQHLLWPRGFSAAGVYSGIKTRPTADVGLLVCDTTAVGAAVFTTNKVCAAPVHVGRRHVASGRLRGVVVNSGNANACTGKQGQADALEMCRLTADRIGCRPSEILPSSTGIIGHHLPMPKIRRGIAAAAAALGRTAHHAMLFCDAILTTDTCRKCAAAEVKIGGKTVRIAGVCKGSGMIGPRLDSNHATLLAYLTTDAQVAAPDLRELLMSASDHSFNAVTVDDHTSTNDTVCILASGQSGADLHAPAAARTFGAALEQVCQDLARQIAADGEGATKIVTIQVSGAKNEAAAKAIARAIANSPLVKCAMNGNDPNWGRIVSAAGMAGVPFDPQKCVLTLAGTVVFKSGQPVQFNAAAVSRTLNAKEVRVRLDCGLGRHATTVWTCDLSKQYVTINADYHT
ncbi:MAG TPA: bifunctional glutamate N-acetyltransferase/amino-acid acetyltransferase ArgJ [Tepidisphaeraceae bacterium]|nr:bifunctional glutamate N-acetyltransferase/amino-acid acetyltransferase ArgJ [Tepidisphaeraceae bacterium]